MPSETPEPNREDGKIAESAMVITILGSGGQYLGAGSQDRCAQEEEEGSTAVPALSRSAGSSPPPSQDSTGLVSSRVALSGQEQVISTKEDQVGPDCKQRRKVKRGVRWGASNHQEKMRWGHWLSWETT
mgnify:CR=1 FL=1